MLAWVFLSSMVSELRANRRLDMMKRGETTRAIATVGGGKVCGDTTLFKRSKDCNTFRSKFGRQIGRVTSYVFRAGCDTLDREGIEIARSCGGLLVSLSGNGAALQALAFYNSKNASLPLMDVYE